MVESSTRLTRVFRAEILKPINYTWAEFNAIVNKATYQSAQLANEVVTKQYLLSTKRIEKDSTFCALITRCKETPLSFAVKCAICQQARLLCRSRRKELLRADISLPTFKNDSLYIVADGVAITKDGSNNYVVKMFILPGVRGRIGANHPRVILRTKGLAEKSNGYYQVLERIASKEYKLGVCQLRRDKVRGKLYLL